MEEKRKPGRPSLGDKKRNYTYCLRLNQEECSRLKDMARERNVTIAKLVRTCIFEDSQR